MNEEKFMASEIIEKNYVAPVVTTFVRRISWGAVFAGLVVVLVTQLTLGVLGIGIGASMVNFQDNRPAPGVRVAAVSWVLLTAVVSLFLGGYVSARLAGVPRKQDSCLHGILTWSAQTIVTLLLVTTTMGGLMSGMVGLLGKGIASITEQEGMGGVGAAVEQTTGQGGVDWNAIQTDAESLASQANQAGTQTEPKVSAEDLQRALGQMFNRQGQPASPEDREDLINAVAGYTGMPREQAEQRVEYWEQRYQQAQHKTSETKEQAKTPAAETAGGVSKVALWTFVTLILGAVAAALGGLSGRPKTLLTEHRSAA
jgi:hypothetical protein